MTTLKELIACLRATSGSPQKSRGIAENLLGKYKNLIPSGKTSTKFIKSCRGKLYGKTN